MSGRIHRVVQHKSVLRGVEPMTLLTDHVFPRHAHDGFGIGVMDFGAQRSWSGIGAVQSDAGDIITVNPGEIHDGRPLQGLPRGWRILYLDPGVVHREIGDKTEITRPALSDPVLSTRFDHAFAQLIETVPDMFSVEQELIRCLAHLMGRYGSRPRPPHGPLPAVTKARQRIDDAPQRVTTLAELAALEGLSRFQLVRGFTRDVGVTPHAYLVQRRVRLARRYLAEGLAIVEVALRCGFADQSHMTRAFVRQFGVTPGRYRAALA
ncbi:helix-turn-helix transcriptional regulator [Lichenifustis flavocetrariae]|uniref:AraC family transcriptional regulator n=1 Tax=Lichenifustis flavocetrariae TaxID=2949735 RepID=A0AA41YSU2_9HYPH|nr:AraC family transcriptional regulator [Lichenifustis flavocetrariae]MCW6506551.1 AraC family transcriptional regulator [Lichenifustis flavocetrariae]